MKKCLWVSVLLLVGIYLSSFAWSQESDYKLTIARETVFGRDSVAITVNFGTTGQAFYHLLGNSELCTPNVWTNVISTQTTFDVMFLKTESDYKYVFIRDSYGVHTISTDRPIVTLPTRDGFFWFDTENEVIKSTDTVLLNIYLSPDINKYQFTIGSNYSTEWLPAISKRTSLRLTFDTFSSGIYPVTLFTKGIYGDRCTLKTNYLYIRSSSERYNFFTSTPKMLYRMSYSEVTFNHRIFTQSDVTTFCFSSDSPLYPSLAEETSITRHLSYNYADTMFFYSDKTTKIGKSYYINDIFNYHHSADDPYETNYEPIFSRGSVGVIEKGQSIDYFYRFTSTTYEWKFINGLNDFEWMPMSFGIFSSKQTITFDTAGRFIPLLLTRDVFGERTTSCPPFEVIDSTITPVTETKLIIDTPKVNQGESMTKSTLLKVGTREISWNGYSWITATACRMIEQTVMDTPGTYRCDLWARGTFGQETVSKYDCVTVFYKNNSFVAGPPAFGRVSSDLSLSIKFTKNDTYFRINTGLEDGPWEPVISIETTLQRSFSKAGIYTVTLFLKDSTEAVKSLYSKVTIHSNETTALYYYGKYPTNIYVFLANDVVEWAFDYGNTLGTWQTATANRYIISLHFIDAGIIPIRLHFRDSTGEHVIETQIFVEEDLFQDELIAVGHPMQGYAPLTTVFNVRWSGSDQWTLSVGSYHFIYSYYQYYTNPPNILVGVNTTAGVFNLNITGETFPGPFAWGRQSYWRYYFRYLDVFSRNSTAKTVELPTVKLFPNETKSSVVNLSNYRPYDQSFVSFIGQNFLNLAYLTGDTINYSGYGSATSGEVHYGLSYYNDPIRLIKQKVQISTYKLIGLPEIILSPGESTTLNLRDYTYNSSGKALASSFGKTNSLFNSSLSSVSAQWLGNFFSGYTALRITTLSGFTADSYLDIVASPSTILPSGNQDIGRVMLKPRKLASGKFNSLSEFQQQFVIQPMNDYPLPPVSVQVPAPDTLQISFSSASEGFRIIPALGNFMDYQKGKWYKATMQARTLQNNNFVEAHLFNMKGVVPGDLHVEGSYNMVLGIGTTWTPIDGYLYVHQSGKGYPIIQLKNQGGTAADVILKDIAVIESEPPLARLYNMEKKNHTRYYSQITSYGYKRAPDLGSYWGIEGNSTVMWLSDRGLYGRFVGSTTGKYNLKLTAIKEPGVLDTPFVTQGNPLGFRIRIIDSNLNQGYQDMFMMAAMGVQRDGEFNIWEKGNQILANYEFGQITDALDKESNGWHYIASQALNPYYQYQIISNTETGQRICLENIEFIQCIPDELN